MPSKNSQLHPRVVERGPTQNPHDHSMIENSPSEIGKVGKGNSRGWSCQESSGEGSRSGTQMPLPITNPASTPLAGCLGGV